MAQSLAQIYLHVVFSTKHRAPFLRDRTLRERIHAYLAGTCRNLHSPSLIAGGVEDHVHLLIRLAKDVTVSTLVRELKRESSKWIKSLAPGLSTFYWQQGYGAFSISPSHVELLKNYIARQEDHHRDETF
jgi:putative transposase